MADPRHAPESTTFSRSTTRTDPLIAKAPQGLVEVAIREMDRSLRDDSLANYLMVVEPALPSAQPTSWHKRSSSSHDERVSSQGSGGGRLTTFRGASGMSRMTTSSGIVTGSE
jgi:hypothetical protein